MLKKKYGEEKVKYFLTENSKKKSFLGEFKSTCTAHNERISAIYVTKAGFTPDSHRQFLAKQLDLMSKIWLQAVASGDCRFFVWNSNLLVATIFGHKCYWKHKNWVSSGNLFNLTFLIVILKPNQVALNISMNALI